VGLVAWAGCGPKTVPFALDAPPSSLVPIKATNVVDARGRFREIFCALSKDHGADLPEARPCAEALVSLPEEPPPTGRAVALTAPPDRLRILVVPGFLNECFIDLASPFSDGLAFLERQGYRTSVIRVSAMSSSRHNARQVRDFVMALPTDAAGGRVILVGHSKGAVDILESLTTYPDLVPRVAAVVSVAGAIVGSPLADSLSSFSRWLLRRLDVSACDPGDEQGVDSLRRAERLSFLSRVQLPASVRYVSLGAIPTPDDVTPLLRSSWKRLASIDPLNDGQVFSSDTVIPGSLLAGFVRADHWAVALPFSRTSPKIAATVIRHNEFPREILLESLIRLVEESL